MRKTFGPGPSPTPNIGDERFPNIRRVRDTRFPHEIAVILPGDYFVSSEPKIVYTVLGSCISACVRDPAIGVGGMNHFMLPEPSRSVQDSWAEPARYGSFAMELLINEILSRGGARHRLEVKLFGAGRLYEGGADIGRRNAEWAMNYLRTEGLSLVGQDLGDVYPRKVYYFTESGRVLLKRIERVKNATIRERESAYADRLRLEQTRSDVTLF
jgi:chemotaxis protein CheD